MNHDDDRWLTMTQAAELLQVSYRTIQRRVARGEVRPAVRQMGDSLSG